MDKHSQLFKKTVFYCKQVGGTDEYEICRAIKDGRITKPVVGWCIGTCASVLSTEVSTYSAFRQTLGNLENMF